MCLFDIKVGWDVANMENMWWIHKDFCLVEPNQVVFFFWEEGEVKKQIDALVMLGKMKPNTLENTCKVILHVKKDGNHELCGDYKPLNLQV